MFKQKVIIKDGYIVLNCPYAEFYVPKYFLQDGLAEDAGEYFKSFGLFYIRAFSSLDKPDEFEILNLPSTINFFPTDKENRKMTIEGHEDDFIVLKFFKGDNITQSAITCSNGAPEDFLNTILRGRIPKNVPYKYVLEAFIKVFDMNKVSIPVPIFTLEMLISEVYRYKNNPSLKYGQVLSKEFNPKDKQISYRTANIRDICKANSSFAGISFENIDEMITSAINNNREKRIETKTPFEDVIKY